MPELVILNVVDVLILEVLPDGSRADDAHLSAQYVDELRQLVQPRASQDPADPGYAGIPLPGPLGPGLLRVLDHGPELEAVVLPAVLAHSLLHVEDGPSRIQLDRHGREQEHRGEDGEGGEGEEDVHDPLHPVRGVGNRLGEVHEGGQVRVVDRDLAEVLLGVLGQAVDLDALDLKVDQGVRDVRGQLVVPGEEDAEAARVAAVEMRVDSGEQAGPAVAVAVQVGDLPEFLLERVQVAPRDVPVRALVAHDQDLPFGLGGNPGEGRPPGEDQGEEDPEVEEEDHPAHVLHIEQVEEDRDGQQRGEHGDRGGEEDLHAAVARGAVVHAEDVEVEKVHGHEHGVHVVETVRDLLEMTPLVENDPDGHGDEKGGEDQGDVAQAQGDRSSLQGVEDVARHVQVTLGRM